MTQDIFLIQFFFLIVFAVAGIVLLFEMACYISVGHPFIVELWLALRRLPSVLAEQRQRRIQLRQQRNAYRLSQRQNGLAEDLLHSEATGPKDPALERDRGLARLWQRVVGPTRKQLARIKQALMRKIKGNV